MKKFTITILLLLFGFTLLPAEVIKTGDHSFYSTKEQMEYIVWDDCTKACQLKLLECTLDFAKEENAEIHWIKDVPDEVLEGMNTMGNCVIAQTHYKNVEIWNWQKSNGETWSIFIIYNRDAYKGR